MFCANCGQPLPDAAHFCPSCGIPSSFAPIQSPEPMVRRSLPTQPREHSKDLVSKALSALGTGLFVVFLIACGIIASIFVKASLSGGKSKSLQSQLQTAALEANRSLPMMVNSETKLERVSVGDGNVLISNFKFVNYQASEIDLDELRDSYPAIISNVCSKMRASLKSGITYRYHYASADNTHLDTLTINSAKCEATSP
jgi:uncharacterized membrane protein YvbJ